MDIRLRNIILCLVNKHFPSSNIGRKRVEAEFVLDELLRVLWTGCPWRSLRSTQSSYQTIHRISGMRQMSSLRLFQRWKTLETSPIPAITWTKNKRSQYAHHNYTVFKYDWMIGINGIISCKSRSSKVGSVHVVLILLGDICFCHNRNWRTG